jgi:predicted RNA-binding protein with PIN domain
MSLHYILDGYNVIRQSDFLSRGKLEDSRAALISFLRDRKPCGSINNKITVVFDGKDDVFYRQDKGAIEVVFARGESADERIKRMVEDLPNPKQAVVVSDDKDIFLFIRSLGARPMGVLEFLDKGQPKAKSIRLHPKAGVTHQQAARINEELKKIWL